MCAHNITFILTAFSPSSLMALNTKCKKTNHQAARTKLQIYRISRPHSRNSELHHIRQNNCISTQHPPEPRCIPASWQQPAPCSDLLDDYNTLHITNFMANIFINLFFMHPHTALVQLHVRIASWGWNAWKISDVSEHSGGAAMHNKCISAHLGTLGHYGQPCTRNRRI